MNNCERHNMASEIRVLVVHRRLGGFLVVAISIGDGPKVTCVCFMLHRILQ
jgi:hypothetical protein